MSSDGSGITRIGGFTVFVPGAAAGDKILVKIVKVKSSYAYGRISEIYEKSPLRTVPECPYYKRCGGCQLLHITYDAELEFKRSVINSAFRRIGGLEDIAVNEIIGAYGRRGYRNKMVFPVGIAEGEIAAGFYAPRSHDIVKTDSCLLGDELCRDIVNTVVSFMKEYGVKPYDERTHTGTVRRIFVRTGRISGEVMVVISANSRHLKNRSVLVERLRELSDRIRSIILNINTEKTNLVLGNSNATLWGKDSIKDTLCGIEYEISPNSFFQVNPIQAERLYKKALDFAALTGKETVLDIYCGIGTVSLYAAKSAEKVIGVEIVRQAVDDAKKNALRNNIYNAEFFADSAENIVPKLIGGGVRPDVVILDPPRKGSDEKTLSAIIQAQPDRIVYISCNPATLARDMKFLCGRGYSAEKATGVDMFPGTVHVETIVLLQKKIS